MFEHDFLLTDLYELSMLEAYAAFDMAETAVFELFVRKLPPGRSFLLAAGLAQLVEFLETARFSPEDIEWLKRSHLLNPAFADSLAAFRFQGDLDAVPEGTVIFAGEPILRVTAALPEAQLIETRLMNLIHFQTVIASRAARMVLAAPGRQLVDFGLRRAHGAEAGVLAARAAYLAGFAASATVPASRAFGIPAVGTMAHSFIQAHESEAAAFERFASVRPCALTLLIDTYDTEHAASIVCAIAPRLAAKGISIGAVRLDSGDFAVLAPAVRRILDAGGLSGVKILVSGGLDEHSLMRLCRSGAPIDGFGIGTSLTTAQDAPALDCAYKLQEYAGRPRRKLSVGKATWPGRKQIFRRYDRDGIISSDTVGLEGEPIAGEALLRPAMRGGRAVKDLPSLTQARAHAAASLARLPPAMRRLEPAEVPALISDGIRRLAASMGPPR